MEWTALQRGSRGPGPWLSKMRFPRTDSVRQWLRERVLGPHGPASPSHPIPQIRSRVATLGKLHLCVLEYSDTVGMDNATCVMGSL